MKRMVIDTISKERSTGILWPGVLGLLTSLPLHRQQEAVGSFEFPALHCLDEILSSASRSLIQSSIWCLMRAFVSDLFLEAPGSYRLVSSAVRSPRVSPGSQRQALSPSAFCKMK